MESMSNYILARVFSLGFLVAMALADFVFAEPPLSDLSTQFLFDRAYSDQPVRELAFGSCNKPKKDQEFWDMMRAKKADVMLLLGDNHYANSSDPVRLKKAY